MSESGARTTRMSGDVSRYLAEVLGLLPVDIANDLREIIFEHEVLETPDDFSPKLNQALEDIRPLLERARAGEWIL